MFDIKLVAYEPFGDRIGELPQPLSIEVGDPLSDMPSMRLKYSRDAIGADLLNKDIEVAVEVYDPNTREWSEPPNGRFLRVRVEGDTLDPIDGLQYMFPGYSWLLTRMRIYPLSATFVQGQVQDASQQEKASLAALNAAEDNVLRALGMKLDTRVEFEKGYPDSQKSVWIDISDLKKPVVKVYKDNEWKPGNAASQRAAVNAVNKWVEHQQSQGQLKDVQDRSRLTKRSFVGRHAGSVFAELLGEAKQRGRLSGMTYKFTTTHDSAGKPWPSQTGMVQVNTGTDLGALLTTFVDGGQLDFRTQGRELQVYVQDTAMNRAPQEDVILRYGLQIDEAPDRSTLEGLAGEVLFMGDDGLMFTRSNPEAMRPWGVWESSTSQSGIKSEAAGQVYAKAALAEAAGRRIERTRGLQFHDGITEPLPYVHYFPGDYIFAPGTNGKSERQRVQQITLTKDGTKGSVSGNLVLNDRFLEHEIRTARRVQAVTNGSSIGGTGSMPEQEQYVDLRTPTPPRYVHGEGEGEYVKNLGFKAFINAEWYWDGNATNGTSMVDGLSSYEVQYRPIREGTLGNQSNAMAWLKAPSAGGDDPTVSFGPVDGWDARLNSTVTYELRVRAVAQNGKVSAWSRTAAIKVSGDAIPPTPPSRPSARAEGSVIWVEWDGKMNSGGQPPSDFFSIQIHEAKVPEGTPTEDDGSIADSHLDALSYSLVESTPLTDTGSAPVFDREYGVNYAYKFTATDFFGNKSEMSPPSGSVHTVPLVDDTFLQEQLKQAREEAERQQKELQSKLDGATQAIAEGDSRLGDLERGIEDANKAIEAVQVGAGGTYVTYSAEPASKPGVKVGDTHFTMSTGDGPAQAIRQQRWDGSAWQDVTLSHQTIASLDLGKATVGELDGGRIKADSITGTSIAGESVAGKVGRFLSLDVGQLTTTGTANINEAVVNNLWAKKIATEKVYANEVTIGRGPNLMPNGMGEKADEAPWCRTGKGATRGVTVTPIADTKLPALPGASYVFALDDYTTHPREWGKVSPIRVVGGKRYVLRYHIASVAGQDVSLGANAGFYSSAYWANNTQNLMGTMVSYGTPLVPVEDQSVELGQSKRVLSGALNDGWVMCEVSFTAPPGAAYMVFDMKAWAGPKVRKATGSTTVDNPKGIYIGGIEMREANAGNLIVDGSITTQHLNAETLDITKVLKANSIEAQYLKVDQIKDAVRIDSDIFNGRLYKGAIFQGGEFRTHDTRDKGIAIFPQGMRVTNPNSGVRTFDINSATGDVTIVGEFSTAPEGQAGIKMLNSASSWNNSDLGIWFTLDGNAYGWGVRESATVQERSVAGIFLTPDSGDYRWGTLRLRGRGRLGKIMAYNQLTVERAPNAAQNIPPTTFYSGGPWGGIIGSHELQIQAGCPSWDSDGKPRTGPGDILMITGNGGSKFTANAGGTVDLVAGAAMGFTVGQGQGIYLNTNGRSRYDKPSSKGGLLRIAANGCIVEDLSSREGKADIQPAAPDERVFGIQPVTYVEKALENEREELDQCSRPMTLQQDMAMRAIECGPDRMFSAIAEEVHDLGLTDLVNYDLDDKPSSLRLELLGLKLLPFVKELWEFKKKYEPVIQKLAS